MNVGDSGALVRYIRQQSGLSQASFAPAIGATRSTVSRWEHEHTAITKLDRESLLLFALRHNIDLSGFTLAESEPHFYIDIPIPRRTLPKREVPKAVKDLREDLDLSQEDFAAMLLVTSSTLHRWENGHCGMNRLAFWQLKRIAILKNKKLSISAYAERL